MELLLALGCLGLAAVMLYPGSKILQRQYYRQQLRYTSYLLAADIRQMQQQTLFQPENYMYTLKVSDKDKHSYRIERAHKIVQGFDSADNCCGKSPVSLSPAALP